MSEQEKLGQNPAFPSFKQDKTWRVPAYTQIPGMSKRFYAACIAMQGILASYAGIPWTEFPVEYIAEESFRIADRLLKQENQEQ